MEIFETIPLFKDVQLKQVFPDGKTFVDCISFADPETVNRLYLQEKDQPGFSLQEFVHKHFALPVSPVSGFESNSQASVEENIDKLWSVLTRQPDKAGGSLIPLPYSYIVPGGRFGEIYYWDSYFTMLGLQVAGKSEMIRSMVSNFAFLIEQNGYIPNGNRTYFLGRSQPPFFSMMVQLLAGINGNKVYEEFLPALLKEYEFWMDGSDKVSAIEPSVNRVVLLKDGAMLNRYWDSHDTPRPESYKEDVELALHSNQPASILFRHLRAGAESGWDYSSRWFKEASSFESIHTTDIIPVDLNCLLYQLEMTIAKACLLSGQQNPAADFSQKAENRKSAIRSYCWNNSLQFYTDYDFKSKRPCDSLTLAAVAPLFFKLATTPQAEAVARRIREEFLKDGGVVTSLIQTGQQWDSPNGWAPLQWMTISGLDNYGFTDLAEDIARRWINLNRNVFLRTGKLMEKYNVADTHLEAGGGEYPGQDGFGWTNGVLLALIKKYGKPE